MTPRGVVISILAVIAMAGPAGADEYAGAYNKANALFAQGDYAGALALYDSIHIENPDLEYNRGAAHLKLGSLGKAALHFMRAQRLRPGDEDAQANLKYIAARKAGREIPLETGSAEAAFERISALGGVEQIAYIALGFYLASALLAAALILARPGAPRAKGAMALVILLTAAAVTGALALYRVQRLEDRSLSVVTAREAPALPEPSVSSEPVFTLHEGAIVRQGRVEGNYVFVTLASGHSGWMDRASLERI